MIINAMTAFAPGVFGFILRNVHGDGYAHCMVTELLADGTITFSVEYDDHPDGDATLTCTEWFELLETGRVVPTRYVALFQS